MAKIIKALQSILDLRAYLHVFRLVHFYHYAFVQPRRKMSIGPGAVLAPNLSIRNGERVRVGADAHIGERVSLWAGNDNGRIIIGDHALIGPGTFMSASNYETAAGIFMYSQPKNEKDIVIGSDVWIGANSVVVAGVTIGDGTVVGAGSVVSKSLPAGVIAAGVPAKVIRSRSETRGAELSGAGAGTEPRS